MAEVFKTVFLLALPASGKSEVRNFMAQMDADVLEKDFHIGENLQLDDFPYVHFMRRIDEELALAGQNRIFYPSNEEPFIDERDWGTLVELLNEDYFDLMDCVHIEARSMALWLFDRIDRASQLAGIAPRLALLPTDVRKQIAGALEDEAADIRNNIEKQFAPSYEGKTLVIECARGGASSASLPLNGGHGYQYSLPRFSPKLLKDAVILYIWVTPEESRRKNEARANPEDPGSNLFHGVPLAVMLGDYGICDMPYLCEHTERPNTITLNAYETTYYLPIGVFDNRVDKTSFLRGAKETWDAEQVAEVTQAIQEATDTMWGAYKKGRV